MDTATGKVFISYETETGLHYAREAARVFTEAGCVAWMWEEDRALGAYPAEEIAENIELSDTFVYLCTAPDQPERSNGQPYERNLAWQLNKPFRVITLNASFVPRMLRAYTYVCASTLTFARRCREIADQLTTLPKLAESGVTYREEAELLDST